MRDWETRYRAGAVKCRGSVGRLKNWKWRQIRTYAGDMRDTHVIDVGCGDGRFWARKQKPKSYIGVDISITALTRLMRVLPMARVFNMGSDIRLDVEAPVVLCLDLIFHLMDEATVRATLTNLMRYSTDQIFIYTWVKDPSPFDESFQAFWPLREYDSLFNSGGFELRLLARPPRHIDPIGGMYIYKKVGLLK